MQTSILAPAAVLVVWSLVMLMWMAFVRFSAIGKLGSNEPPAPGLRGQDIDPLLPASTAWKSHNYAHLMEQPTIFYAAVLIIAVAHAETPVAVNFAWAYTALRIVHSIYQATMNVVMVRFSIFLVSTLCLAVVAYHALMATI
jgi:hypothetical protein